MKDLSPAGATPRPDIRAPIPGPGIDLGGRVRRVLLSDYFVLYLSIAYLLVLVPFLPTLSTPGNLTNLMSNMWPLLVVAVGQTFVLTIAGIDLSQGAVMGLTSVVTAVLIATAAPAQVLANAPVWGSLQGWAERGVLLLNSHLSVEEGLPASHAGLGWEALTDGIVAALSAQRGPKVFMLWGAHAQRKAGLIAPGRHLVLASNHPSPLSARRGPAPFIGCGHFGRASAFLAAAEPRAPCFDWRLPAQARTAGEHR